ncbi:hypothetical protein NDU88_000729 [Pleurodeles waltl]|uniref:Uncharacterized protein n=1 Tax=Pleurodeles waltl TaxID=8319 RepID=A0AAV7TGC8_PLEWA|nr:hypothetical protein NDU88_000729 [Pleurodeles waltl]
MPALPQNLQKQAAGRLKCSVTPSTQRHSPSHSGAVQLRQTTLPETTERQHRTPPTSRLPTDGKMAPEAPRPVPKKSHPQPHQRGEKR